ncbi:MULTISPECIES: DinB family protein [Flavobacterium]|uniref:DinB-like domain-containing protein n=1 Tax=Flavobacterium ginsengisoli TaxID=871694 RepID=A0ABP7FZC7_9FLAO|nr:MULTISPECIES: DinB family protein [Flavobacterium]MBJ2123643.1 DinB family protein [Flavobacterium sp. IB48]
MEELKGILWRQFGAVIDMLESSILVCPDNFWDKKDFWYSVYHTIFWIDYYSSVKPDEFSPPQPFSLSEFDPEIILPERIYLKEELLEYLEHSRKKVFLLIEGLNEETSKERFITKNKDFNRIEMILYNMRHVQHHVGQLNLLLRQNVDVAGEWVSQTDKKY